MLVEHRTYTLPHGRTNEYVERYERYGLPVQERYLGKLYGFFISEIGPLNQVVFLWAYESLADREARRAQLERDPDWMKFRDMNIGSFVMQESRIMRVAHFSPPFPPRTEDRSDRP
ncbi:NIPSNAP family protein [Mesorhizobium sp. 8]|uniref:NIPSNAP family protein n=1 Tax=Mesorhizobium sp. 8 TaxID=2584466 RepID=UPI00111F69AD|nr:NIPSNAP family protein [Mesorhizobium sp. 8]QDC00697.1 NIPSNAP family protein [Mesorhizobium sp. 8]